MIFFLSLYVLVFLWQAFLESTFIQPKPCTDRDIVADSATFISHHSISSNDTLTLHGMHLPIIGNSLMTDLMPYDTTQLYIFQIGRASCRERVLRLV